MRASHRVGVSLSVLFLAPWSGVASAGQASTETSATAGETEAAEAEAEPADQEAPRRFDTTVTVTTGLPELAAQIRVSGDDVEASREPDLVRALRTLPGVAGVRRGSINLDPVVRGLQETEVAALVDGTRTFAAGPGRMDSELSHVSAHAVESVEVVKGPYALTWGAGALSAVRLETRRPPFRTGGYDIGGRTGYRYLGNGAAHDAHASLWGAGERTRFELMLGVRAGADYEAGGGERVPGDYSSYDARWSFGVRPGEDVLLEYVGGYQEQRDLDYPGRLLDASYFETHSHLLRGRRDVEGSWLRTVEASVYVNLKSHRMNNDEKPTALPDPDRVPPFGIAVDLPARSDTWGGRLALEAGDGPLSYRVGADFYALSQDAHRTISRRDNGRVLFEDVVWPDAEIRDTGVYAQVALERERTRVGATVRVDFVEAAAGAVSDFFAANTEGALNDDETNLSAAVSARLPLGERWSVSAGAGRAVRTASVLERYSDRFPSTKFQVASEFLGDPALPPEAALQADLGLAYQRPGLEASATLFRRAIDDYITVAPDPDLPKRLPLSPPVVYRYVRGDQARSWGGELRVSHDAAPWLSWRGSLSWVRGEDTLFGEPLFGQPPLAGELAVRLRGARDRYWLDARVRFVDDQERVAVQRLEVATPGYELIDLTAGLRPAESLELSLALRNLTDERFADHLDSLNPFTRARIPGIGRSVGVSLEYRF